MGPHGKARSKFEFEFAKHNTSLTNSIGEIKIDPMVENGNNLLGGAYNRSDHDGPCNCSGGDIGYDFSSPPSSPGPIKSLTTPPLFKRNQQPQFLPDEDVNKLLFPLLPSERMALIERDQRMNTRTLSNTFSLEVRPWSGYNDVPFCSPLITDEGMASAADEEQVQIHSPKKARWDTSLTQPRPRYFLKPRTRFIDTDKDHASFFSSVADDSCCPWPDMATLGQDMCSAFDIDEPVRGSSGPSQN